ncbi:hypothetical protein M885DRAFT_557562 [Pelagophyceae sp. CCMP2097]|nr:hypothetical protein M885DRAFT_557562 [Pelagophyceae sp. CCMP2097]
MSDVGRLPSIGQAAGAPQSFEGAHRQVEGAPVEGAPVEGAPVDGAPVEAETAEGPREAPAVRRAALLDAKRAAVKAEMGAKQARAKASRESQLDQRAAQLDQLEAKGRAGDGSAATGATILFVVMHLRFCAALANRLRAARISRARAADVAALRASAATISRLFARAKSRSKWRDFARYATIMKRQRLRLLLHVRCFRRWHAANVALDFLQAYMSDSSKLRALVMQFLGRVAICQRWARGCIRTMRGRLHVLGKLWAGAEASLQKSELEKRADAARAVRDRLSNDVATLIRSRSDFSKEHVKILADSERQMVRWHHCDNLVDDLVRQHHGKYDDYVNKHDNRPNTAPLHVSASNPVLPKLPGKAKSGRTLAAEALDRLAEAANRALPAVSQDRRTTLLARLVKKRKQQFLRGNDQSAERRRRRLSADEDDDGNIDDSTFERGEGKFTPGDARRWLNLGAPTPPAMPGSPVKGKKAARASAANLLLSYTTPRFQFYAEFGGRSGLAAEVAALVRSERARMAEIREAEAHDAEERLANANAVRQSAGSGARSPARRLSI